MEYTLLTQAQHNQITHQKLLELEAEHARLELDIRLSLATGVQNEAVMQAQTQLDILTLQIATLISWLTPPPPPEADTESDPEPDPTPSEAVSSNGREPAVV